MADVVCTVTDCKHCGRKSSKYQRANGEPVYICKKTVIQIREPYDPEGYLEDVNGRTANCSEFELK